MVGFTVQGTPGVHPGLRVNSELRGSNELHTILSEPDARQLGDTLQRAWLLEEMRRTRDDFQLDLTAHLRHRSRPAYEAEVEAVPAM